MSALIEIILIVLFSLGCGSYIWWITHEDDDLLDLVEWLALVRDAKAETFPREESWR